MFQLQTHVNKVCIQLPRGLNMVIRIIETTWSIFMKLSESILHFRVWSWRFIISSTLYSIVPEKLILLNKWWNFLLICTLPHSQEQIQDLILVTIWFCKKLGKHAYMHRYLWEYSFIKALFNLQAEVVELNSRGHHCVILIHNCPSFVEAKKFKTIKSVLDEAIKLKFFVPDTEEQ
jgi:hypothetical protein